jgi:beta-glucosidase
MTMKFPKRFLWGVSTSAHQVEGGNHNQWSVWEQENAKANAAQGRAQYGDLQKYEMIESQVRSPENYVSGTAADHYTLYENDFDLAKKMQLNAFRFSVEWSRIEPQEGAWNAEAIEHYKQYVKALKKRDIEPMMTLFHFTMPVWFAEKGGFTKRKNVRYFVRFAQKIVEEIGVDIKFIITINEPEVYATQSYVEGNWPPEVQNKRVAFKVLNNLIYAHNKTARIIHSMNRRYKVSIAKNTSYVYPGDDAVLSRVSAAVLQYLKDDYVLKRVRKTSDFIGVNYYFSDRVYGYRVHNEDRNVSDMDWDMHPENIEYALERISNKYKMPIIITENGVADMDDEKRKWWLAQTMAALHRALEHGVKLQGYFHWSMLDNFEWAHGHWPKFGLVKVDPTSLRRTPKQSAIWWAKFLAKAKKG